jgi:TrwC relaxase
VVDVARMRDGEAYTDFAEVPHQVADPQLHIHNIVPNVVLTDGGHVGSIDGDTLRGRIKEYGAVAHAFLAKELRAVGVETVLDPETGAAKLTAVPERVRDLFSKRTGEAEESARQFAADRGADWNTLSGDQRVAMMKTGAAELRQKKDQRDQTSDFAAWREQAAKIGYEHRSVLRPDEIQPALSPEARRSYAYDVTQPMIDAEFQRRAKVSESDLREIAARGLIPAGIDDPATDIRAVMRDYYSRGVQQHGERTAIIVGNDVPIRGRAERSITTALHEAQERELISLAQVAAADRSAALTAGQIDQAAGAYLTAHPRIDPTGAQWKAQHAMMH